MKIPALGFTRASLTTLGVLAVFTLCLVGYTFVVSKQTVLATFAENGPIENASIVGWLLLAAACLWNARLSPRVLLPAALVALLGAVREDDFALWFTSPKLFQAKFYKNAEIALPEKLFTGVVALILAGLLIYMLWVGARTLLRPASWSYGWALTALLALGVGGASLVFDKLQSYVHDFTGHWLPQQPSLIINALEEGLEMALPLLFLSALLQYRATRRGPNAAL